MFCYLYGLNMTVIKCLSNIPNEFQQVHIFNLSISDNVKITAEDVYKFKNIQLKRKINHMTQQDICNQFRSNLNVISIN
jgi:hypothetical protein